uniref:Uncharacterized protein n=1 Tax=Cannabis sativa TaxID=3483 RepID=A0A803R8L0_CANSA
MSSSTHLFRSFYAAEDSYSDSCSGSVANCSTFLSRLCSQLSLGCPYEESSIINFEVNRSFGFSILNFMNLLLLVSIC